jgi:lipopolysaccharide export system permease protein
MKNINELSRDIDSLMYEQEMVKALMLESANDYLYHNVNRADNIKADKDTIINQDSAVLNASILPVEFISTLFEQQPKEDSIGRRPDQLPGSKKRKRFAKERDNEERGLQLYQMSLKDLDSSFTRTRERTQIVQFALSQVRNYKVSITSSKVRMNNLRYESDRYKIEKFKKYSQAFACIVMFLIGAPLGAIIKKGGLGFPVIISIFFFIIYYVLTISSEKWAKAGMMDGALAVWVADIVLLPIGLFFLRQARIDARLFDADFYLVVIDKFKRKQLS